MEIKFDIGKAENIMVILQQYHNSEKIIQLKITRIFFFFFSFCTTFIPIVHRKLALLLTGGSKSSSNLRIKMETIQMKDE